MPRLSVLILLVLLSAAPLCAQEAAGTTPSDLPPGAEALASMSGLRRSALALDIAVSTWYELADMCRKYGLIQADAPTLNSARLRELLYGYFGLKPPGKAEGGSSVSIERSGSMGYFSLDGEGDSAIELDGGVSLKVVTPDGFTHVLQAERIRYDRKGNGVQAAGEVRYERAGNNRSDVFTGQSLAVDLDDYTGLFLDGGFDMQPGTAAGERTTSLKSASVLRRNDELILFENAIATACDEPEPHYSIRAGKLWLLGSGDWAIQDAVLFLGRVPVLWLPFFYYPSDEIVFHPVFGYRSREGSFLQTTTYIIGKKAKSASKSGLLSIVQRGSDEGEKSLSGIFLRRTKASPASPAPADSAASAGSEPAVSSSATLRVLADLYTSLGAFAGVQGKFPVKSGSLDFSAGIAASRSLFLESTGYYSPFDAAGNYSSVWDQSDFAGFRAPFRYGANLSAGTRWSSRGVSFDASVALPIFSDPWYEQDFMYREEDKNWIDMAIGKEPTITQPTKRTILSQALTLSGSWNPQVSDDSLLPRISIPRLASSLAWKSKAQSTAGMGTAERILLAASPTREFFYPDTLTLLDTNGTLSGVLLTVAPKAGIGGGGGGGGSPVFTLGWNASGSAAVEEKFNSATWTKPESMDWSLYYSLFTWKGTTGLSAKLQSQDGTGEFLSTLQYSAQDQTRPLLVDERTSPTTVHPYLLADYRYRQSTLLSTASLSLRPFARDATWSPVGLTWQISPRWMNIAYSGLSGTGPDAKPLYATTWAGWNTDSIKAHSAEVSLGARTAGYTQKLSLSASLPPLLDLYTARLDLDAGMASFNATGTYGRASAGAAMKALSLTTRASAGKDPWPTVRSDFAWDFDGAAPLSSVSSLGYKTFLASYTMRKARGYYFSGGSWIDDGSEYFRPYEAKISFSPSLGGAAGAKSEGEKKEGAYAAQLQTGLSGTASFGFAQNLVRFTESAMTLDFSLRYAIGNGFALNVNGSSINKSAWRYVPELFAATASFDPRDYRKDFISDLVESVSVWDTEALLRGSFKLKSLAVSLTQSLHDWDLSASLSMAPKLYDPGSGRSYYRMDVGFTLGVKWKDVPEVATNVVYKDGAYTQ